MCRLGVSLKSRKERRMDESNSEAFKDKGGRGLSGKEGVEGKKRGIEMEGRAVC